ncbi:uncharacterized protein LOC106151813 [Lingula anatina]|uniref:Uncharacterized protein LOC106151813 n=1 Tax=Lingula anatina TaxID=7574 RepID=A0A1S3H416_LINAN|nr:uncharacterized protein LOC106151813 [Lingula anatina]XP_013380695.1 uncharacterized protein LOC106151813 [Lingula anatina]XP_013380702.1 uncharacterized protein LOC106151813 [Lingula anatina]XP_013380710.1 uncharacterized protein LOC106151813 [Lingula anatina]|eukprot:XP_013380686.1 uncharacterized protein LOC106151813 [Lingula anatina]
MSKSKGPSASSLGARGPRAHGAREYMYTLVDTKERLDLALENLRSVSKEGPNLAVDGQGVDYSRRGKLSLIVIATRNHVFLFDIIRLGELVFDRGLLEILEDPTREKLMFDCRQDSDILWHQYHVKLDGALDIQLLQVMHNRGKNNPIPSPFSRKRARKQTVEKTCVRVVGLTSCLEKEKIINSDDVKSRRHFEMSYLQDLKRWTRRPIHEDTNRYACECVSTLFALYDKMKSENITQLKEASGRYVDLKRSISRRIYDDFEENTYLPLNIITYTEYDLDEDHKRELCQRHFPSEALMGNRIKKCKVCFQVEREKIRKLGRKKGNHKNDDSYYGFMYMLR